MIVPLRRPSDDTAAIVGAAVAGLKAIYQPGYRLAKAGVMLLDIQPASRVQCEFNFETTRSLGGRRFPTPPSSPLVTQSRLGDHGRVHHHLCLL